MNSKDFSRLSSAIADCICAETKIGRFRPGEEMTVEEFIELCDIKKEIQVQRKKMQSMLKSYGISR